MIKLEKNLKQFSEVLKKIDNKYYDLIEEFEGLILKQENFKLYDLIGYIYDNSNESELQENINSFYNFTFWEFEQFLYSFDIELHQIGNTSNNYITSGYYSKNWLKMLSSDGTQSRLSIYEIIDKIDYIDLGVYVIEYLGNFLDENDEIRKIEDIINDFKSVEEANEVLENLIQILEEEYIIDNHTYNNLKTELEDLRSVWEYIELFKEDQIEYYKKFMEVVKNG